MGDSTGTKKTTDGTRVSTDRIYPKMAVRRARSMPRNCLFILDFVAIAPTPNVKNVRKVSFFLFFVPRLIKLMSIPCHTFSRTVLLP